MRSAHAASSRAGCRPASANPLELLPEIGERRLKSMDDAGITVQVLSNTGPGPDLVPGPDGVTLARALNDQLATHVAKNPKRFAGLAVLPMASPKDCAAELRRAVKELGFVGAMINGTCEGRFLDHPSYDGLLAAVGRARRADLHPSQRADPESVRQAYYSGLAGGADRVLESAGWGWHSEVAIHIAAHGAWPARFDKHPQAQDDHRPHGRDAAGDAGARRRNLGVADIGHLSSGCRASTILEQVWITTSGIFTQPPFVAALQTFGIDRIMFSVDYPFALDAQGRDVPRRSVRSRRPTWPSCATATPMRC